MTYQREPLRKHRNNNKEKKMAAIDRIKKIYLACGFFHVQAGQLNFEILTGQYTQIRHYSLRGSTSHKKRPFNINTKHINIYPALVLLGKVHCTDCINSFLHRCSLFEWKRIYRVFIYRLFIHVSVLPFGIQLLRGVEIRLDGSTLPHFCACPKPGPGFPTSYVVVFVVLNDLR